jgi:nucleoside-diphosphate-sugar epimerase
MHVLMTGAASFIGKHLIEHLMNSGLKVTATYRTEGDYIRHLHELSPALNLIRVDIRNWEDFAQLPESIDAIVHIAGVSPMAGILIDEMLATNVMGTRNVHRYALEVGVARLICTSSLSVHGKITVNEVDEFTSVVEPDLYGMTKYLGERLFLSTAERLPAVAIRLPGVLGGGAHRAWLPNMMEQLLTNNNVIIYNPNSLFNNAIHVDDLSDFILKLLVDSGWSGFHAFPVAASDVTTVGSIVKKLKDATGSRSQIIIRPPKQSSFIICSKYAMDHFGYRPKEILKIINRYLMDCKENIRQPS